MTAIRKTMNGKTLNTLRLQTNQDQPLVAAQQKTCFISSTQESGLHLGFIAVPPCYDLHPHPSEIAGRLSLVTVAKWQRLKTRFHSGMICRLGHPENNVTKPLSQIY